jgi:hypothetical protein
MTTIAVDKRTLIMASDRQTNDRGLRGSFTKIRCIVTNTTEQKYDILPNKKECLVGCAGLVEYNEPFFRWVRSGMNPELFPSCVPAKDFQALFLTSINNEPIIYQFEDTWIPFIVEEDFYAIGTGNMPAMAAMLCGKSVEEAVEIACMIDVWSGGGINKLTLKI